MPTQPQNEICGQAEGDAYVGFCPTSAPSPALEGGKKWWGRCPGGSCANCIEDKIPAGEFGSEGFADLGACSYYMCSSDSTLDPNTFPVDSRQACCNGCATIGCTSSLFCASASEDLTALETCKQGLLDDPKWQDKSDFSLCDIQGGANCLYTDTPC